jgi:hypothetical protein
MLLPVVLSCLICAATPPQPQEVPVDLALAVAHDAYTQGPIADRVVVTFTDQRGISTTSHLTIRIDAGAERQSPIVAITLGNLRLSAYGGRLVGVHDTEATTCWVAEIPERFSDLDLFANLPPVPLPQLSAALAFAPAVNIPYAPTLRWRSAMRDPEARLPTITIQGESDAGPATLVLDADTGRIRHLDLAISDAGAQLQIDVTPIPPGDPNTWVIDTGARLNVERLGDLTRRPSDLGPGDPAPELRAYSFALATWTLSAAIGEGETAHPLALLSFIAMPPGTDADRVRDDVMAAREALSATLDEAPDLTAHAVAVIDLKLLGPDDNRPMGAIWKGAPAHPRIDSELRWTDDAAHAIRAFDADSNAMLIVIRRDRRIAGVLNLDGCAENPDALAQRLRELLASLNPPPALPEVDDAEDPVDGAAPDADQPTEEPDDAPTDAQGQGGPPKDPPPPE